MRHYTKDEAQPFVDLIKIIEDIVKTRDLHPYLHRIEIEKVLFNLLKGKDILNPYERRNQGVDDDSWENSIKKALYFLNLRKSYEKIFKK